MMSGGVDITFSHSEDSFDEGFDCTPIPFDNFDMSNDIDPNNAPPPHQSVDHQRAPHGHNSNEWLHNDASSHQSWLGGGGSGSWFEQTTSNLTSCCQMLPDAFMPPRHSFTPPPESPSSQSQRRTRTIFDPPPPPRKPAPASPRTSSPTSGWRNMRSSCYEASRRYYKNDYGSQNYNHSRVQYQQRHPEQQQQQQQQPPPQVPPPSSHHYAPPRDQDFVHHTATMDTADFDHHSKPARHPYAQAYSHDQDERMITPQPNVYSATPQARKYSNEYREPAPEIPPIVSPTPTYPSPKTVAKATAAEMSDASSICDDPRVLRPNDIVCGRGAPSQFHRGNAAFRDIISDYQTVYLCARRSEKPRIANQVMEEIRKTGGRFVRRTKKGARGTGVGAFAWEEIDDKKALEKVCQALRDGAPELQRMLGATR